MEIRTDLPLRCMDLPAAAEPRGTLVLLHGLGARIDDLASVAEDLRFPVRCLLFEGTFSVSLGEHYEGRGWYDRDGSLIHGLDESLSKLLASLDALGLDPARTVVAGFSQGAAVALEASLAWGQAPAGLAMLAGYVPQPEQLYLRRERVQRLYCLLCHGTRDEVVPFGDGLQALEGLSEHGARARLVAFPASHWIPGEAVVELRRFLDERLPGA